MRQHVGKIWSTFREPRAEIAQRQMTEQLALERRKHDLGMGHVLGQVGPVGFSQTFALKNVARHPEEITQRPRELEHAAMPEEILVSVDRTRYGTQGEQGRWPFDRGEVFPERQIEWTERAGASVCPRQSRRPFNRVLAVGTIVDIRIELP